MVVVDVDDDDDDDGTMACQNIPKQRQSLNGGLLATFASPPMDNLAQEKP